MIVVAVVAILAAIAYPAYTDSIRKARRSEAIAALGAIQQAQERWRSNKPEYTDSLDDLKVEELTPNNYYKLKLTDKSKTGYTATATANGSQASDAACASLSVTMDKANVTYDKTGSAPTVKDCWKQ